MIEIIKKIQQLQLDKKKLIIAVIILIIILYIDLVIILGGQFNALKEINPKIAKLKNDIKNLNENLVSLKGKEKTREVKKETSVKVIEKIAKEENLPYLLEEIQNIANKRQVRVNRIIPLRPSAAKPALTSSSTVFLPLSITMDISAGYHQLGRFINGLENAALFMAVDQFKITSGKGSSSDLEIQLLLKTYVKK